MRTRPILYALPLLALAACHAKVDLSGGDGNEAGGNVQIAMKDSDGGGSKVSVKLPGFNANVSLPKIDLSGHVDLDGITLAPHSKVSGLDVSAQDGGDDGDDNGTARLRFTDSDAPAAVIDHYARSAADAGFGDVQRTASSLTARKDQKTFTLDITPDGAGSRGTITMAGRD